MPLSIATFESPLDLLMIPGDGTFTPIQPSSTPPQSPSNGRFFRLRFESSSEKKFFWLQAEGDKEDGKKFSERDLKIGTVVDRILRGEDVDVKAEFESVGGLRAAGEGGNGDRRDSEGDVEMSTGGAGEGATGGDAREEGEESRQGGGDGARA